MGRAPCCEKQQGGLKKGPWAPEEDKLLVDYIHAHGCGNWRSLPKLAGLLRCGKSCRLRWSNYLRPDIKRGAFTAEEEKSIVHLHAILGNKWSTIAANIQGRTDNEIKNYWNTHLKKRLLRMGIVRDTYTTTPTPTKPTTATRHMAQWESARLEAEARLSQESLSSSSSSSSSSSAATNATNYSSAADKSLTSPLNPSSPMPVDFFLRIWNSPIGDAFRKPVTSTPVAAAAAAIPPPHTSPLWSSNVTTSNEAMAEETSEEEEEDSYQLYFDFAAGDDLGFLQGQTDSCYSSLLADLNEASLDTAFK